MVLEVVADGAMGREKHGAVTQEVITLEEVEDMKVDQTMEEEAVVGMEVIEVEIDTVMATEEAIGIESEAMMVVVTEEEEIDTDVSAGRLLSLEALSITKV